MLVAIGFAVLTCLVVHTSLHHLCTMLAWVERVRVGWQLHCTHLFRAIDDKNSRLCPITAAPKLLLLLLCFCSLSQKPKLLSSADGQPLLISGAYHLLIRGCLARGMTPSLRGVSVNDMLHSWLGLVCCSSDVGGNVGIWFVQLLNLIWWNLLHLPHHWPHRLSVSHFPSALICIFLLSDSGVGLKKVKHVLKYCN